MGRFDRKLAKKLKGKIKKNTGASISFALAFFLVAAMVCSTIVAASVTAVKRTNDEKERMQAQLTLESCAKQLEKGLKETHGQVRITRTFDVATGAETGTAPKSDETTGAMKGVISRAMVEVLADRNYDSNAAGGNLKVTLAGNDEAVNTMLLGQTEPIQISFTMQKPAATAGEEDVATDYDMTFTLKLKGKSNKEYVALMSADAIITTPHTPEVSTDAGIRTEVTVKGITWGNFKISAY